MSRTNKVIDMTSVKEIKQCLGYNTKQAITKLNQYECMIRQMMSESKTEFQKNLELLLDK